GIDQIIKRIVNKLGNLEKVFLTGSLAAGNDSKSLDLIFVGEGLDSEYLLHLVQKSESFISRKILFRICNQIELELILKDKTDNFLLIWQQ
ncbi:MAG: ArsR family transcriptional regulator, partial [Bacteroidota bacterium]